MNLETKKIKVALVHDWLNGMRGGEKVLESLCRVFPDADIFTIHSDLSKISDTIKEHKIYHSFIQYIPFKERFYRWLLPLFPLAVSKFNFKEVDIIISTSHCAVKNISNPDKKLHICYCFSPIRYVWALKKDYFGKNPIFNILITPILKWLKRWDFKGSKQVSFFIAVSKTIKQRIKDCYGRDSSVIYPPLEINFTPNQDKKDYFCVLSALTPYKKIELAIKACNKLNVSLKIAGIGPELNKLKSIAGSNVEFLGWVSHDEKLELLKYAKALLFPGLEDFGIVPLEAMSFATPVIGFGQGGLTETVISDKTGVLFDQQNEQSLINAIKRSENLTFKTDDFKLAIENFSESNFQNHIRTFVSNSLKNQ